MREQKMIRLKRQPNFLAITLNQLTSLIYLILELKAKVIDFNYFIISRLNTEEHLNRVNEIVASIETTNLHEFNVDELNFGCRTAWRNAPRCPGRIFWPKLDVI